MNARKYAWKIFHAELRRRVNPDEGLDLDPQMVNIGALWGNAMDENIAPLDIVTEVAGFGATFAERYGPPHVLSVAKRLEQHVLAESDEDDDEDEL